jgi:beta-phosphoglucomutase-like phosphatase (HAD superfamily)
MRSAPPPSAILFDLDGTLVDTVPARIDAWLRVFEEFDIPASRERVAPMIGMDGIRLATDAASAAGRQIDQETAHRIDARAGTRFDELNRHPQPLPGVSRALAMLDRAGITWAIGTSSRPEQVTASVGALKLAGEPRIIDGSSVEHAKPAPDLLLLAARTLAVEAGDTWYVGDSTWDMRAAVAAGMLPIGVLAGAAVDAAALRDAGAAMVWRTMDALLELGWA